MNITNIDAMSHFTTVEAKHDRVGRKWKVQNFIADISLKDS